MNFRKGERVDYNGGRTKDAIVEWVLKKSGPPSTEVTCAVLKEKAGSAKFLMAYFGADTEALYTDVHVAYATAEDKIQFVHTSDADCAKEHGVTGPALVFFRQFEEKQVPYTGKADKDALIEFVKPLMVPTVFPFSEDEIEAVFGQQQDTLMLFIDEADKDAAFMKTYEEAAKVHKGKMLFSYAGISKGIQEKLAEFMGVTKDDLPTLRAIITA